VGVDYGVDARCYWSSSHCIPAQKFVSMSGELNHDRSPLVLDPTRVSTVTASLHSLHQGWQNYGPRVKTFGHPGLHELDRQSQPSRGGCHICEMQNQLFTFCRPCDTASIFSTGSSACTRSVFCWVRPSQNENQ